MLHFSIGGWRRFGSEGVHTPKGGLYPGLPTDVAHTIMQARQHTRTSMAKQLSIVEPRFPPYSKTRMRLIAYCHTVHTCSQKEAAWCGIVGGTGN